MIEERILVRVAKDQFNVIVGHVLNAAPLSKAEADRLAGRSPVVAAPDDPAPQPSRKLTRNSRPAVRRSRGRQYPLAKRWLRSRPRPPADGSSATRFTSARFRKFQEGLRTSRASAAYFAISQASPDRPPAMPARGPLRRMGARAARVKAIA
jgi:hypothetical protein